MVSRAPTEKTAGYVIRHGGWRVGVALAVIILPFYLWIIFYYLSTGAYNQSPQLVAIYAPILSTFIIPLVIACWVIGFRRWHILVIALAAGLLSSWLPSGIANDLLPGSYVRLALVLVLVAICVRAFQYWREYIVLKHPVARYTRGACVTVLAVVIICSALLLPIHFNDTDVVIRLDLYGRHG